MKLVVSLLTGITLGSSVIGSGVSVANASENSGIIQTQQETMSKYNPKTNITTVTVSDAQYVQYLLDYEVKEKDIPYEGSRIW